MRNIYTSLKLSLEISWKSSKLNVLLLFVIQVINGFLPVTSIYLFQKTIDNLTIFLKNGGSIKPSILYLLLQVLSILFMSLLGHINKINNLYMSKKNSGFVKLLILEKIDKIPFIRFENPTFNNEIQMVTGVDGKIINNVTQLSDLVKYTISLFSVLIYLINVHISLPAILIVGIIPYFIIEIRYGKSRYNLNYSMVSSRREESYIMSILTNRDSIKEVRLFNIHKHLVSKWNTFFNENNAKEINLTKNQSIGILFTEIITIFTYALTSIAVVLLIGSGKVMIGALIAVIQSIQNIQDALGQSIKSIAGLFENSLYINQFNAFLEEKEHVQKKKHFNISHLECINIDNLTFTYPNQKKCTLKNISFTIKPKKKIAIIGLNGAGKTTLIKCLMGLYPTDPKAIQINNIPLHELDLKSYQSKISVLFQDYQRYQLSLRENIAFGDLTSLNDEKKLKKIIEQVGLDSLLSDLPQGYNNRLGRMFEGGNELSGGQWQKIAIARSLYRESELIIMDEPTAALDPKAEVELMEEVFDIFEDKAIVYITHRLGAAWKADEILVIKDGEILEQGNHIELLKMKGEYSNLYKTQSQLYSNQNIQEEVRYVGVN